MRTMNFGEQWGSMEKMFLPKTAVAATLSAAISTVFIESAHHFWEYQEKAWHNMQAVADGWFERRRTYASRLGNWSIRQDHGRGALWSTRIVVPAKK